MGEFDAIQRKLSQRLEELLKRQGRVNEHLRRLPHPDSAERAQEAENDEVLADLELRARGEIDQIRRALDQIERGEYGECAVCGGAIARPRLEALPFTIECIDCANSRERSR